MEEELRKAENALWHSIRASRNPADFDKYLEAYPKGRYRFQARQRRDQLIAADRAAYQRAQSVGTVQSLEKYLSDYPHGRYRSDARARLKELRKAQEEAAAKDKRPRTPKSRYRECSVCPEMVVQPREGSKQIAVGRYEVTFDEWEACRRDGGCSHNPSDRSWGRGKRPVINVSFNDAQAYVRWLSKKTENEYRLLSEPEWERASLGEKTRFRWDEFKSVPVGSSEPNAHGLYDMAGNVWEWLESCASTGSCTHRVLRGGEWGNSMFYKRSNNRNKSPPEKRQKDVGFRVASTLE